MTPIRNIPWSRIVAEGTIIVVSILLAFAIEAWWQDRIEAATEQRLLRVLLVEFERNNEILAEARDQYEARYEEAAELIDSSGRAWSDIDPQAYRDLVRGLRSNRTFHLESGAHDGLLASGELSLIRDDELRNQLASWRSYVAEWAEEEDAVFKFVANELSPYLSNFVRLRDVGRVLPAFPGSDAMRPIPGGEGDLNALRALHDSMQFENLVYRRAQWTWHAMRDGETLRGQTAVILDLIRKNLDE